MVKAYPFEAHNIQLYHPLLSTVIIYHAPENSFSFINNFGAWDSFLLTPSTVLIKNHISIYFPDSSKLASQIPTSFPRTFSSVPWQFHYSQLLRLPNFYLTGYLNHSPVLDPICFFPNFHYFENSLDCFNSEKDL